MLYWQLSRVLFTATSRDLIRSCTEKLENMWMPQSRKTEKSGSGKPVAVDWRDCSEKSTARRIQCQRLGFWRGSHKGVALSFLRMWKETHNTPYGTADPVLDCELPKGKNLDQFLKRNKKYLVYPARLVYFQQYLGRCCLLIFFWEHNITGTACNFVLARYCLRLGLIPWKMLLLPYFMVILLIRKQFQSHYLCYNGFCHWLSPAHKAKKWISNTNATKK